MNRFTCLLCLIAVAITSHAFCQQETTQWFVSPNVNLYLPIGTPQKGMYPVLWYDKGAKPGFLVGGLGVGVSVIKLYKGKVSLKGQANVSKHTYWDEPYRILRETGEPLTDFLAASSDYTVGLGITTQYYFSNRFSAGIGVGTQFMLISLSRLPDVTSAYTGSPKKDFARNRYYKPIMPVIPIDISYILGRTMLNLRYEHAVLNRIKGELSEYKKDKYGLLTFEIGFKLN